MSESERKCVDPIDMLADHLCINDFTSLARFECDQPMTMILDDNMIYSSVRHEYLHIARDCEWKLCVCMVCVCACVVCVCVSVHGVCMCVCACVVCVCVSVNGVCVRMDGVCVFLCMMCVCVCVCVYVHVCGVCTLVLASAVNHATSLAPTSLL